MQRARTPVSRRITWSPGRRLRFVLLATTVGSVCGLVFGLTRLDRPLLNAAAFYLVGAALAGLVASLVVAVRLAPRRSAGARRARRR